MTRPLELVCEGRRVQAQHGVIAGRDPSCALVLSAERVSRQHFVIEVVEGAVYVRDLFSRNGTRVNGAPIERAALRAGDRIEAGVAGVGGGRAVAETPAPPPQGAPGAPRRGPAISDLVSGRRGLGMKSGSCVTSLEMTPRRLRAARATRLCSRSSGMLWPRSAI